MKPLDQIVRDRVAPPLKAAGFQRKGRKFWLDDDQHGSRALVEIRSYPLGEHDAEFLVEVGARPRIYEDFVHHKTGTRDAAGLWWDRVRAGERSTHFSDYWSLDLSDEESGQRLTEAVASAVPKMLRLLDPANLLAFAREPTMDSTTQLRVRRDVAIAMLLAEQGQADALERQLEELEGGPEAAEFDSDFRGFVRTWLADRG